MFVMPNRSRGTFDLQAITGPEFMALLQAVSHELIRSRTRQEDARISESSRGREEQNGNILSTLQRRLRAHEGDVQGEPAPTVH